MELTANPNEGIAAPALRVDNPSVSFDHVGFAHAGRTSGLADINVTINAGERVVLRGRTGAGKSTVLALILGLVHAERGTVHVAGIDVAGTQVLAWSDAIAWLPQHPHLFRGSVADNVRLGMPDATDADVREALAITGATFVDDLPDGLNTIVGERGLTLSGGQRQRIALARTLLRGCPIVLLDEPLAHLDARSRESVALAIERCTRGRTIVIAAHELDNFGWADRSIDLEETAPVPGTAVLEVAAP
jgi:ABC-type multidrug transport system fused ATPase/permease subunit